MSEDKKPTKVSELYEDDKPPPAEPVEEEPGPLELKAEEDEPEPEDGGDIPAWVREYLPSDFRIPRGAEVVFVRFRSKLTAATDQGVMTLYPKRVLVAPGQYKVEQREELTRVLVLWPINDAEEKMALKRCGRDNVVLNECTKQMVRLVDGKRVDWTGEWAKDRESLVDANAVWKELGPKGRQMLKSIYAKLHQMTAEEQADFFVNCLAVRSAVAG